MTTVNSSAVSVLNELLEICRDAEKGFRSAANDVEDEHLRILFSNYCQQRAQLGAEMAKEVRRLGGSPDAEGSTLGAIHRGWMNLKSAMGAQDDAAVLAECDRAEAVAIERYEEALRADMPAGVRQIISRQHAAIKAARDRICELEKSQAS